jgi:hypothetical protein
MYPAKRIMAQWTSKISSSVHTTLFLKSPLKSPTMFKCYRVVRNFASVT